MGSQLEKVNRKIFFLLGLLMLALVVCHHYWALDHIAPIHDASNCVSRASNMGILLSQFRFNEAFTMALDDKNNFLALSYFGIFSSLFGPGRAAWGWAWAGALFFTGLFIFRVSSVKTRAALIYAVPLTVLSSNLVYRVGGVLDQRFDGFACLIIMASIILIYEKKISLAILFSIFAILSKGPALPIVGAMWFCALICQLVRPSQILQEIRARTFFWAAMGIVFLLYFIYFLIPVISYNLMAVSSAESKSLSRVFWDLFEVAQRDGAIYIKWILERFWMLPVAGLSLAVAWYRKIGCRKEAVFSLCFFGCTYILFSIHPIKSDVLLIWFVPATWAASLYAGKFLNGVNRNIIRQGLGLTLAILMVLVVFTNNYGSRRFLRSEYEQEDFLNVKAIAEAAAEVVGKKSTQFDSVTLAVNFLYNRSAIVSYNYDALRVLIFEKLGRAAPIIDGWEFGTYSDKWKEELLRFADRKIILSIVSDDLENRLHPFKRGQLMYTEVMNSYFSPCRGEQVLGLKPGVVGKVFLIPLSGSLSCVD